MGIEFIHTATLVHDDLIDKAPTRRGIQHDSRGARTGPGGDHRRLLLRQGRIPARGDRHARDQLGDQPRGHDHLHGRAAADDQPQRVRPVAGGLPPQDRPEDGDAGEHELLRRWADRRAGRGLGREPCAATATASAWRSRSPTTSSITSPRARRSGKPVGADLRQGTVTLPLMLALKDPRGRRRACATFWPGMTSTRTTSTRWCGWSAARTAIAEAERSAQEFAQEASRELRASLRRQLARRSSASATTWSSAGSDRAVCVLRLTARRDGAPRHRRREPRPRGPARPRHSPSASATVAGIVDADLPCRLMRRDEARRRARAASTAAKSRTITSATRTMRYSRRRPARNWPSVWCSTARSPGRWLGGTVAQAQDRSREAEGRDPSGPERSHGSTPSR